MLLKLLRLLIGWIIFVPTPFKVGPPAAPATTTTTIQALPMPPPLRVTAPEPSRSEVHRSTTTTSTTTEPAPTTSTTSTTAAPVPQGNHQSGQASWLVYGHNWCAHKTIPKGTTLTVHRLGTDTTITCLVADRGPYVAKRIVDLDKRDFARLADPNTGVIDVEISW